MKASDSLPEQLLDVALDVVAPLIDHRRWHVKWRIFYLARVGIARGEDWTAMPVRELALVTGRTDYWVGKVLKSMVRDHQVLLRDPPYSTRTGSRPAAFTINPAIPDWRMVPWDLPRERVLSLLGYHHAADGWVLPRSYDRGTTRVSAAVLLARHNQGAVRGRPGRKSANGDSVCAAVLERGTNLGTAASLGRGTTIDQDDVGGAPSPFSGVPNGTHLSTETHGCDSSVDESGTADVLEAVLEHTGNAVWARPKEQLLAIVERQGAAAVIARIGELAHQGMHPAQLVELLAIPNAKKPKAASPQHRVTTEKAGGRVTL